MGRGEVGRSRKREWERERKGGKKDEAALEIWKTTVIAIIQNYWRARIEIITQASSFSTLKSNALMNRLNARNFLAHLALPLSFFPSARFPFPRTNKKLAKYFHNFRESISNWLREEKKKENEKAKKRQRGRYVRKSKGKERQGQREERESNAALETKTSFHLKNN